MDMTILADALAPVLRDLVADALTPVLRELADLKKHLDDLPPPVDPQEIIELRRATETIVRSVEERISALPTAEDVAALVPTPNDGAPGRDADPAEIVRAAETAVAALPRPQDGKSVSLTDIRPMVEQCVQAAVSALPAAKDGARGEAGPRGERGPPGDRGEKGGPGADGRGLADALIDREGWLVLTMTNGTVVKLGLVVGKDGAPGVPGRDGTHGVGFDDLEAVDEDGAFVLRFARDDVVKEFRLRKPTLADAYRGVWKEGPFKAGDVVTWGGSLWIAARDTEAKPETDDAWRLVVKRGRDGKDGELKAAREQAPVKLR